MQVLRGAALALILLVTAGPLADVMGVPQVAWGFRLMALVPFVQGFTHLDMTRVQRVLSFGPFIKVTLGAEVLSLLAVYPLFLIFGDYRVALFALLLQQGVMAGLSHVLARRRYHLELDGEVFFRALAFGWPLLFNALLMFGIFQGDRIIVANQTGAVEFGLFSLAFMLAFMSTNVLAQTLNRLFLPKLARLQDDLPDFERFARIAVQAGLVVGLAVAAGFSLFGPDLVLIVFGSKYAGALGLLVWMAVMQAVRIAKLGVSLVAIARAETRNPLIANIPRVLLLPLAWLALDRGANMLVVVWIATAGELLGLAVAFWLLRHWLKLPVRGLLQPVLLWAGVLLLVCVDAALYPPRPEVFANFHWMQAAIALAAAGAVFGMRDLRIWALGALRGA
jgi:O-antigen/teichoic acid export membrane protein